MGCDYEASHHEAAHYEAEDHSRPCVVEGDRASLREVSGVTSVGCIVGDVDRWGGALRGVWAGGICTHISALVGIVAGVF